jgi:hypothetical protein
MFIGTNNEAHQAATQKLMEAAVFLRRAADSMQAAQAMLAHADFKNHLATNRKWCDKEAEFLDNLFQRGVQEYFSA